MESKQLKLGFFPKAYLYAFGDKGIVIEKERDNVCIYATDAEHHVIYAAIPLGHPKEFRGQIFDIREFDSHMVGISVGSLRMVFNYAVGHVAVNRPIETYGSDAWGRPCDMPWTDQHSTLFKNSQ